MDEWDVFFYDEENDCVSSLTKFHAEECSIEPLVEAHPSVIYFYAELVPHKDWDFNQVAYFSGHDPYKPIGKVLEIRHVDEGVELDVDFFCNGEKDCPGSKHANDCPKWEA